MPSRKKDRGRQRKAAKQNNNGLASTTLPPAMQGHMTSTAIRNLKEVGCCVIRGDDGNTKIRHPCLEYIKGNTAIDSLRDFDRGLLNDDERQELARNYVHNYAQDLREGDLHGTEVIGSNVTDPHIGPKLVHELLKAGIHLSFLHFLNQSDKRVSDVLGRGVDVDESIELPYIWVGILGLVVEHGCSDDEQENVRIALARGIEPFVMAMMDDKRELFRSNHIWHKCLLSFFGLMRVIMKSKDAFLVMISYEGFLPFVAQASCWSQSREDIVAERDLLRRRGCDAMTTPGTIDAACCEPHRILCLVMYQHHDDVEGAVMNQALDQIARTPLLSDDPNCNESTVVGFIRMMNSNGKEQDLDRLFRLVIVPLLLEHCYVDARVIAALIEYGRDNPSMEAVQTVLSTMVSILGRDNNYEHIEQIDSRYAAAIRHGLWEFCIDALVVYGVKSDCEIGERLYFIAYGLCLMAMHNKTSRALRERKADITSALDVLRKKSAPRSEKICTLIDDAIDASAPATCCNCLQAFDRKKLLFCQRCNIECYCSLACQSESYGLGHDELCKEEMQFFDGLREEGLNETELKRLAVLSNNLMMNGCTYVRSNIAEILDRSVEEEQIAEVTIDFGECPPDIEVSRTDTASECSGSVKCTFIVPVYYGFYERVDREELELEKFISRREAADALSFSFPLTASFVS